MLVYRGIFDLRRVQAVSYIIRARRELSDNPAAALHDAEAALAIAPTSVRARLTEAHALEKLDKKDQAAMAFAAALKQAGETGKAWYPAEMAEARKGLLH
jgi:Tfp pilus assembly protein PilF